LTLWDKWQDEQDNQRVMLLHSRIEHLHDLTHHIFDACTKTVRSRTAWA
jgi:hypothetical protein